VKRTWGRLPPVMERTLRQDVMWALFVLAGAALAYLLLGADEPSLLLGALLGVAVVIIVLNFLRRVRPRRKA
jgi:inner membrane protein involved in colicin E2 resistance